MPSQQIPPKLYKYVSFEGAKAILRSSSLRLSSPVLLNDPFDGQVEARFSFTPDQLEKRLVDRMLEHIEGTEAAPSEPTEIYTKLERVIREQKAAGKSLAEIRTNLIAVQKLATALNPAPLDSFDWKSILTTFRICALSEIPGSLTMWSHYADAHHGVCLEFSDTSKGFFGTAKAVAYQDQLPEMPPLNDWTDFLLALRVPDVSYVVEGYIFRKSPEWKSEKEWRVITRQSEPDDLYRLGAFSSDQLTGIYFGVRTSELSQSWIRSLCQGRYLKAECYQAVRSNQRFELEFTSLPRAAI